MKKTDGTFEEVWAPYYDDLEGTIISKEDICAQMYTQKYVDDLQSQLQEKGKIIEDAIEYVYNHSRLEPPEYKIREFYNALDLNELLSILERMISNE